MFSDHQKKKTLWIKNNKNFDRTVYLSGCPHQQAKQADALRFFGMLHDFSEKITWGNISHFKIHSAENQLSSIDLVDHVAMLQASPCLFCSSLLLFFSLLNHPQE